MALLRRGWLLVCGLALAVAAPASAAEVSKYVPADTEVLAYVNVRQILDAPLTKKYALERVKAALAKNPELQLVLLATGLDPFTDIQSVFICSPGTADTEKFVAIVQGKFDVEKIDKVMQLAAQADPSKPKEPAKIKILKEGSLTIYQGQSKDDPNQPYITFFDKNTAAISLSKEYLLSAAKAGTTTTTAPKLKKELQALVDKADNKQSLWVASLITDDMRKALAKNDQTADIADKLTNITGHMDIGTEIVADFRFNTTDAKSAGDVAKLLDGVKGIASFAAQGVEEYGPLLGDIIDAFEVKPEQNSAVMSAKIPESLIQKGLKKKN